MAGVFQNSLLAALLVGAAGSVVAGFFEVHWLKREGSSHTSIKRRYTVICAILLVVAGYAYLHDGIGLKARTANQAIEVDGPSNASSSPGTRRPAAALPPTRPTENPIEPVEDTKTVAPAASADTPAPAKSVAAEPRTIEISLDRLGAQDTWTTSIFSNDGSGRRGPGEGTGRDNGRLRVGGWADYYVSLLRFDLPALDWKPRRVVLRLYRVTDDGTPTPMYLDMVTSNWSWSPGQAFSWRNLPSHQRIATIPAPAAPGWYDIDITQLFDAWSSRTMPNYGFMLTPVFNQNNYSTFASTTNTDGIPHPRLIIEG